MCREKDIFRISYTCDTCMLCACLPDADIFHGDLFVRRALPLDFREWVIKHELHGHRGINTTIAIGMFSTARPFLIADTFHSN